MSDVARSKAFYRCGAGALGYTLLMEWEAVRRLRRCARSRTSGSARASRTFRRSTSRFAPNRERRSTLSIKAAMAAGGSDNGAPGPRPQYHPRLLRRFCAGPGRPQHRSGLPSRRNNQGNAMSARRIWPLLLAFAASGALSPLSPPRPDLAGQADQVHRRGAGGQLARRAGAHDRRQAEGPARTARSSSTIGPAAGGTRRDRSTVAKSPPDGYTMVISFNGPSGVRRLTSTRSCPTTRKGSGCGDHHVEPAERARGQRGAADPIGQGARSTTPRPIRASSTTRRSATAARRT